MSCSHCVERCGTVQSEKKLTDTPRAGIVWAGAQDSLTVCSGLGCVDSLVQLLPEDVRPVVFEKLGLFLAENTYVQFLRNPPGL